MALVLPRRLAPVFPTTYSHRYLPYAKAHTLYEHLEFPYHTLVHCKGFAPAAPRRAGVSVSVPLSGLPLSRPRQIVALVGLYPTNKLICRHLILCRNLSGKDHFRTNPLSGISLRFPRLSQSIGQINDVLLSMSPVPEGPLTCMAKSNSNSSILPQDQRELLLYDRIVELRICTTLTYHIIHNKHYVLMLC